MWWSSEFCAGCESQLCRVLPTEGNKDAKKNFSTHAQMFYVLGNSSPKKRCLEEPPPLLQLGRFLDVPASMTCPTSCGSYVITNMSQSVFSYSERFHSFLELMNFQDHNQNILYDKKILFSTKIFGRHKIQFSPL